MAQVILSRKVMGWLQLHLLQAIRLDQVYDYLLEIYTGTKTKRDFLKRMFNSTACFSKFPYLNISHSPFIGEDSWYATLPQALSGDFQHACNKMHV